MVGEVMRSTIEVDDVEYERLLVRTHWIDAGEDISAVLRHYLAPHARPGDWAIVSEKATVIATGGGVPASEVRAGRLARVLAGAVRPIGNSRGLSIPEKMQLVIERTGRVRIVAATVAAAITRPLGVRGAFYVIAGRNARGMDGMRPPLEHMLIPPLAPREAAVIADRMAAAVGVPVAIVDINDRGGSVRAGSAEAPPAALLQRVLRDNPLGQRDQATPIGLIRPAAAGPHAAS